jgi:soluble lytic murein transglycosylase
MVLRNIVVSVFFIFVFLVMAGEASAGIYKYVDSEGVTHFTNVPDHGGYEWVMRESSAVKGDPHAKRNQVRYDYLIRKASRKHDMDPALVKAVIEAESDFDTDAESRAGAVGLMQLMPETAKGLGVEDRSDPFDNIEGGVIYLKSLLVRFKRNIPLALAAYNAGAANVERYGKIPPFKETENFVERVLEHHRKYSKTFNP